MAGTDDYNARLDAMEAKVDAAIKSRGEDNKERFVNALKHSNEVAVIYSAYENDDNDLPTDNLDEVAYKGTFIVTSRYHEFWDNDGNGTAYRSEPITDPTWLQLAVLANDCIFTTKDFHHAFFEGAADHRDGTLEIHFGS